MKKMIILIITSFSSLSAMSIDPAQCSLNSNQKLATINFRNVAEVISETKKQNNYFWITIDEGQILNCAHKCLFNGYEYPVGTVVAGIKCLNVQERYCWTDVVLEMNMVVVINA